MSRRALVAAMLTGTAARAADLPITLPRSATWDMRSTAGHRHRILLGWPKAPAPPGGYPALLLLDGHTSFPIATALARQQEARGAQSLTEPAVLVGLTYPEEAAPSGDGVDGRSRDYTLPAAGAPAGTGGADAFLDFVEQLLLPDIAARLPLDRDRLALFGHSYGGLCALHAFFTRPALFRATIAASPSIWWGNGAVLAEESRFAGALPPGTARRRLLITVGSREQRSAEEIAALPPARQERARMSNMVGRAGDLAARLSGLGPEGPEVAFVNFPGEDHGSVIAPAIGRAVRFALAR
ncbi:alpha/beta hydrolase [Pseudoroseomonas oryzae]|uniref:Alpha/beta hydrolase n=1 Tax=Teichococcus oryzae TaxID=1608942 RepID=A0A5B2TFN1_9PROT|nr:alpha/beta hydrolase [Pseudoroseomonas oryzae]